MLRRNSSKRRSGLSRSQSSISFRSAVSRLEHLDPVVAKRDALIAAQLCYNPGMESESLVEERPSWDGHGLPRDDSNIHRPGDYDLRRRQSIRFVNNDPGPRRSMDTSSRRSIEPGHRQSMDRDSRRSQGARLSERASFDHGSFRRYPSGRSSLDHGSVRQHRISRGAETHASSRASSRARSTAASGFSATHLHSMHSAREYDRLEDDGASILSVARHIRKSRSMCVPLSSHGPAVVPTPKTSYYFISRTPDRASSKAPTVLQENKENHGPMPPISSAASQGLRTPKSMSFLKTRRDRTTTSTSTVNLQESRQGPSDLAVQLAREKFREQVQKQEQLKSHPSLFFRTTRKRSDGSSGFRKSLRNTSNASTGMSLGLSSSNNLGLPKDAGLRKTARKVSNGLKTKLKNFFRRAKGEEDAQYLQTSSQTKDQSQTASAQYDGEDEADDNYMEVVEPEPDECSVAQVTSRVPSLHAVPSSSKLRSRQGSIESIRSEQGRVSLDDKSRVTSWTSSAVSSIANDKMHQRLSIIRESALPLQTVYSESTYSQDKPGSIYSEERVATEVPIYSPATFTSRVIPPSVTSRTGYSGSGVRRAELPGTVTPSMSLNRIVSAASSVEWKTQLASQVSKQENGQKHVSKRTNRGIKFTMPSMPKSFGHVRERAEIEDGEPMSSSASFSSSKTLTRQSGHQTTSEGRQKTPVPSLKGPQGTFQPPTIPVRSSLRPLTAMSTVSPYTQSGQPVPSTIRSVNTMPDLHGRLIANKENAAPPGTTRSASPVKLVKRIRPRNGAISAGATPLGAVAQTTQLGSPVARGESAAACPRLSRLMIEEDPYRSKETDAGVKSDEDAKVGGGQRMVDMFLSSRRRRIAGSDEAGAFL